jgi:hypothetical protein
LSNSSPWTQSFTNNIGGRLSKIEIMFIGAYSGTGTLQIYRGKIDDNIQLLHTQNVSIQSYDSYTYTTWDIISGTDIVLNPGFVYTIKFIPSDDLPDPYGIAVSLNNSYVGGSFCEDDSCIIKDRDLVFRVYVGRI